jgi:hypothetical protein
MLPKVQTLKIPNPKHEILNKFQLPKLEMPKRAAESFDRFDSIGKPFGSELRAELLRINKLTTGMPRIKTQRTLR